MDQFGECITETVQRQHDDKMPRRWRRWSPCTRLRHALVQGVDTAGNRTPRFKKISLVPTDAAD